MLMTDGSSRNFTYNDPVFGCGTGSADPRKPSGTFTDWENLGSSETESIKKRLEPDNLQASSGAAGHFKSFSIGRRTRLASGCQSPRTPLALIRNCKVPK